MNALIRLIAFVFLFCADITVHADELTHGPFTAEKKEVLTLHGATFVMAKGSLVTRADSHVQLVRGDFYYEGTQDVDFKTPFAVFSCAGGDCRMLIKRAGEKVEIKNLRGSVIIKRTGENRRYVLPTAMQVSVGRVTGQGFSEMEFPQSLPWIETSRQWAALYPGDLKEFRKILEEFRSQWKEAVEAVSDLHLERAGREIASAQRAADEAAARAASIEREDAKLRALFRDKTGYGK